METLSDPIPFEHPCFLLKIYPEADFAKLTIRSEIIFDENAARASKKILEETNPGRKYFLLVSSEGFFRVTKEVRKLGASRAFSSHIAAIACYTSNISLFLLGELYNKINKPAHPTRVFSSKESAMEWLYEQAKLPEQNPTEITVNLAVNLKT